MQESSAYQGLVEFFNDRNAELQKYLLWQVKSPETAEDLAQETYLRFLRMAEPSRIADLNAFLFTIAANLARDHLRGRQRVKAHEFLPLDAELEDSQPAPDEIVAGQLLGEKLEAAIASLPEKTREVFLLYRADGLSYRDVAKKLGISERTVEYHVRQALLHCRRCLAKAEGRA